MLHIKSQYPALVVIDKEYLLENHTQEISLPDQNLIIKYYPLDKNINGKISLPSVINITTNELINCDNYIVTLYPNNHIEILLKPSLISTNLCPQKETHKIENSEKTLQIFCSNTTTIAIKDSLQYLYYEHSERLSYIKGIEIDSFLHLFFEAEKSKVYLHIKNDKIKSYILAECNITKSNLSAIMPYHDMAGSGKAIEINFAKPYTFKEKTIYINQKPKLTTSLELIPYAFLESINAKNYNLARHYMTDTMSKKLTNKVLSEFFGDIKNITHDMYNDKPAIIYKQNQAYIAKNYEFELEGDKISNINEL